MAVDPEGTAWWHWLLGAIGVVFATALAVAITAVTAGTGSLVFAVALGALKGAAMGLGIGAAAGATIGAIAGGIIAHINKTDFWTGVGEGALLGLGIGAFAGAIVGAIVGGISGYIKYQPTQITGFTKHGINNALSKNNHGVNEKAMLDAVKNPTKIFPQEFRTKFKFVGKNAVVVLNKVGKVVTTWARNKSGWRFAIGLWLSFDFLKKNNQ